MSSTDERRQDRESLLRRIRSMMAMTVENGCTEEEAVNAARMVAYLLDKYDLDHSDISGKDADEFQFARRPAQDEVGERLKYPGPAIATLTGCRYWTGIDGARRQGIFFGRSTDVMIADYLLEICENALRRQGGLFDASMAHASRGWRLRRRLAFLDGMALELRKAILAIHAARHKVGTGLVVAKNSLVDVEMCRRGLNTKRLPKSTVRSGVDAFADGKRAGAAVAFSDGVTSGTHKRQGMIGR